MAKTITLTKAWGRHKAGAVLEVWEPGAQLGPQSVDPARAEQLVADKLAAAPGAPKPKAPAKEV